MTNPVSRTTLPVATVVSESNPEVALLREAIKEQANQSLEQLNEVVKTTAKNALTNLAPMSSPPVAAAIKTSVPGGRVVHSFADPIIDAAVPAAINSSTGYVAPKVDSALDSSVIPAKNISGKIPVTSLGTKKV